MTAHAHTWTLVNAALRRYRCACGVIGFARAGKRGVVPYLCQQAIGAARVHCARPATYVTGIRTQSRCDEHTPTDERTSFGGVVTIEAAVPGGGE